VEAVLDRSAGQEEAPRLGQLLRIESIAIPLKGKTRGSVIRDMCELAVQSGMLWDSATMAEAVKAREALHPTALDSGVALLHPRRPQTSILADSVLALGVCASPIPFSDEGQLTDIFFLICSYDDQVHLRILARLSRLVANVEFLAALRNAGSPEEALELVRNADEDFYGNR
jgi:PTS system nitrogen regulatory IIA component